MKTLYEALINSKGLLFNDLAAGHQFSDAVLVVIDNVAEYMYQGTAQEIWDFNTDFPNVAPPFPMTFLEWAAPQRYWSEGKWIENPSDVRRMGCLVIAVDTLEDDSPLGRNIHTLGVRWGFEIVPCGILKDGTPFDLRSAFRMAVSDDGKPVSVDANKAPYVVVGYGKQTSKEEVLQSVMDRSVNLMGPALLAFSFLHCKNVETIEHGPHLRKPGTRARHAPRVKYYTLEIEPMKKVLRTEGESEKTGLKRALHICRGHFAHYSDDKPLFGKYSGTFWKPMHVKGSKSQGEVIKDYSVKV